MSTPPRYPSKSMLSARSVSRQLVVRPALSLAFAVSAFASEDAVVQQVSPTEPVPSNGHCQSVDESFHGIISGGTQPVGRGQRRTIDRSMPSRHRDTSSRDHVGSKSTRAETKISDVVSNRWFLDERLSFHRRRRRAIAPRDRHEFTSCRLAIISARPASAGDGTTFPAEADDHICYTSGFGRVA